MKTILTTAVMLIVALQVHAQTNSLPNLSTNNTVSIQSSTNLSRAEIRAEKILTGKPEKIWKPLDWDLRSEVVNVPYRNGQDIATFKVIAKRRWEAGILIESNYPLTSVGGEESRMIGGIGVWRKW